MIVWKGLLPMIADTQVSVAISTAATSNPDSLSAQMERAWRECVPTTSAPRMILVRMVRVTMRRRGKKCIYLSLPWPWCRH